MKSLFPVIQRARGYYLYDNKGKRLLDLYQDGGKAILGHTPNKLQNVFKSTVAKGLLANYPSVYKRRFEKHLKQLLPNYNVVGYFSDYSHVSQFLGTPVEEPFFPKGNKGQFWRPFLEKTEINSDFIIPILPLPGSFAPVVLCVREGIKREVVPNSIAVSPVVFALLTNTINSLIAQREPFLKTNPLSEIAFYCNGPYCLTNLDDDKYREFWLSALDVNILLPPTSAEPIIVAPLYSEGEFKKFMGVARQFLKS